jgi:hypothetical protein
VFEEKEWHVKGVKAGEEAVARIKRILEAVVLTLPGNETEELETLAIIKKTEHEFLIPLRSPGIDSQRGGPLRQPYLTHWPPHAARLPGYIG